MTSQTKLVQTWTEIKSFFLKGSCWGYEFKTAILKHFAICNQYDEIPQRHANVTKLDFFNSLRVPHIERVLNTKSQLASYTLPLLTNAGNCKWGWQFILMFKFLQWSNVSIALLIKWSDFFVTSNVWIALLDKFLQLSPTFTLSDNSHISRASKSVLSPHGKFPECTKHGAQVIRAWIGRPGCPCLCPVVEISLLIKYLLGTGDTVYPSTATTCCLRPLSRLKGTNALFWFQKQAS